MAKLTFSGLSKYFYGKAALDHIDAEVQSGEFVALLGPSGCGKTTLLRMTAGFEKPDDGQIHLGGQLLANGADPRAFLPPEDRNMGIVFQSYALWPHMTVAKNVAYPLEVRRVSVSERAQRVAEALSLTGLSQYANRSPAELSGGQRQRVALARCLVADPRAVLLDEPLANLDLTLRATMQEAFTAFHRRTEATMLYVTHDQTEAMALADRVAIMSEGRIRQFAAPEVLYAQPCDSFVAGFVGDGTVVSVEALGPHTAGALRLRALGTEFVAKSNSSSPTHLCIRPENISITADGPIAARVRNCAYQGGRFRLTLETEGETLVAFCPTRVRIGEDLRVAVDRPWAFQEPHGTTPAIARLIEALHA